MTKPPAVIHHEGWVYRRVRMVGRGIGRPPKKPRVSDTGAEEWYCPCCEDWYEAECFGTDNNASNGLKSWCNECCREASTMRRALSTGELPDWEESTDE